MRRLVGLALFLGATLPSTSAHALAPSRHREISQHSCDDAGLPHDFCRRIGVEAYVTDADEFDDPAAHSQAPENTPLCESANAVVERVRELGNEARAGIDRLAGGGTGEATAEAVGRLLHTIQDNCAHQGIPNSQHAWYSLDDFCNGTTTSPDLQADAIACAWQETDAVMADLLQALDDAGASPAWLARDTCPEPMDESDPFGNPCDRVWLPTPWDACDFLGSAEEWDGVDRSWNRDLVGSALRSALWTGLLGGTETDDVCHGDPHAIDAPHPDETFDVSGGTPTCTKAHLVCLGKADDMTNLWEEPADLDLGESGGCAVGGHSGSGLLLVLMALLGLALPRRRRD